MAAGEPKPRPLALPHSAARRSRQPTNLPPSSPNKAPTHPVVGRRRDKQPLPRGPRYSRLTATWGPHFGFTSAKLAIGHNAQRPAGGVCLEAAVGAVGRLRCALASISTPLHASAHSQLTDRSPPRRRPFPRAWLRTGRPGCERDARRRPDAGGAVGCPTRPRSPGEAERLLGGGARGASFAAAPHVRLAPPDARGVHSLGRVFAACNRRGLCLER